MEGWEIDMKETNDLDEVKYEAKEEEKEVEVHMQRQSRRTERSRICEQEDTNAGRADQCSRTVRRQVSH